MIPATNGHKPAEAPTRPMPGTTADDIAIEEALLAGLLSEPDQLPAVAAMLVVEDFYMEQHGHVYAAMLTIQARGARVGVPSIASELKKSGRLEQMGGLAALGRMFDSGWLKAGFVEHNAGIVADNGLKRRILSGGAHIAALGYRDEPAAALVGQAQEIVLRLVQQQTSKSANAPAAVRAWSDKFDELLATAPGAVPGLATGFPDFDSVTGGLRGKRLYIVAARPSVGKSSFAGNVAAHACLADKRVLLFSLEMTKEEIVSRWIADLANVNSLKLENGNVDDAELARVNEAAGVIDRWNFEIDDSPGLSIAELSNRARGLALRGGCDLLIVDHIQLMNGGTRSENRNVDLGAVTSGLKKLAKELDAPVLALSQLNRQVEQRADHRPMLADLRESGNIEQDGDVIGLLYRAELYSSEPDLRGQAELIIEKNRTGPTKSIPLFWQAEYTRFMPVSRRSYEG